ncbi:MAG: glycosyltransferase [Bacteroidales bacterium]|jgi:glycosyltransferase involved in cell wall biosynthesis|nr:glycosyltransferase [Bacteroidales bacterium]
MLSILIPVYNFDCSKLITSLHYQASNAGIQFEILVYDDCSTKLLYLDSSILSLSNLKYKTMEVNLGRSAIRNLLASDAKYTNLLFIDCDCLPNDEKYIQRYISKIGFSDCVCGGTLYPDRNKIKSYQKLHWLYGTKREMKVNEKVPPIFVSSNFLIKKEVFESILFDDKIKGYGHEDTIFGIMLLKKGYSLTHIDNPIIHWGLNNTSKFLLNAKMASKNLRKLYDNPQYCNDLLNIRLVQTWQQLHIFKIDSLLWLLSVLLLPFCEHQLKSKHPSLRVLDFYKLLHFIHK